MFLKILFGSTVFILKNSIFHKYSSQAYPTVGTVLEIPRWTLKSTQKIDISPVPSIYSASLVYLLVSWLLIIFPDHSSCLFPVQPLLLTHALSQSSVKFIPNSCYLTVPLANSSQICWSQDLFTVLKITENPKDISFCGHFYFIYCMTN